MMKPEILNNWELDLLFRIDLAAMRPYNGYGMTPEKAKKHRRMEWERYNFPTEYEYVFSYIRLAELKNDFSSYITYVRDLYFWALQDPFPLEQALGLFSRGELQLFICDENDMERPFYKHIRLLQSLFTLKSPEKNYEHTVWGYLYRDNELLLIESDDLLDDDEEGKCFLVKVNETKSKIKQLTKDVGIFFDAIYGPMSKIIPQEQKHILNTFFSFSSDL